MITRVYPYEVGKLMRLVKKRASNSKVHIGGVYRVSPHGEPTAYYVHEANSKIGDKHYLTAEYKNCFEDLEDTSHLSNISIHEYSKVLNTMV